MQQPSSGTKPVTPSRPSLTELHAMGKSLREKCPRHSHADWNAPDDRPDPLRLLDQANRGRIPELIPFATDGWCGRRLPSTGERPSTWRQTWRLRGPTVPLLTRDDWR